MTIAGEQHEVLRCRELFTRISTGHSKACMVAVATDGEYLFHVELLYKIKAFSVLSLSGIRCLYPVSL